MSGGGSVQPNGLYLPRHQPLAGAGWRQIAAATLFRVSGDTIQPHRLYVPRGGRQVAAPTVTYHFFAFFEAQNVDRHVKYTVFVTNVL